MSNLKAHECSKPKQHIRFVCRLPFACLLEITMTGLEPRGQTLLVAEVGLVPAPPEQHEAPLPSPLSPPAGPRLLCRLQGFVRGVVGHPTARPPPELRAIPRGGSLHVESLLRCVLSVGRPPPLFVQVRMGLLQPSLGRGEQPTAYYGV